jgi:porphobilinogen synthase
MSLPDFHRGRRLRRNPAIRALVRETRLTPDRLLLPLFVTEGDGVREPVGSMPGVARTSIDGLVTDVLEARELGIGGVLLFGVPSPSSKDERGTGAWAADGIIQRAIATVKDRAPDVLVATDVCLCEYTSHGHCGLIDGTGMVGNDVTLELLAGTAVSHARAGADLVAPSDMMDGRVGAIREALDDEGYLDLPIMSYAAKYSSAFYGPFREAAGSAPSFGDRKSYQMDPANGGEALREVFADLEEGADIIMVKPALPYLDVIRQVADRSHAPVAAYQVSGEYAAILAGARAGHLDGDAAMMEALTSIHRAGAGIVVTYWARQFAMAVGNI